jgi:putative ABC transport system permease protein
MSLWKIAWRSIQERALSSTLTAFSISLGVALVVAVLAIHSAIDRAFRRGAQGYDLIVGAKGGQLPLVLSTVFYLQLNQQFDPISYEWYDKLTTGPLAVGVQLAVPVCLGHDYKDCQVVATSQSMFDRLTYGNDQKYTFSAGTNFHDESPFEAVVGAAAARRVGLKLGSKFRPVATGPEKSKHSDDGHSEFTVVGILAPTGTPNDRAIFINLEGFFRCPAHAPGQQKISVAHDSDSEAHHEHHHHGHKHELSAILVRTKIDENPIAAMSLPDEINRSTNPGTQVMAVKPAIVIADLFDRVIGNVQMLLLLLSVLVVVVAGMGILLSIYNSMNDRRHDIAVMRALGASRTVVMFVILMESILLSLGGGLLGVFLGHGLTGILAPKIASEVGVSIAALEFQPIELLLVPGLVVLATIVGYLPAAVAYRTDVAKSLQAGG